MLLFMSVATVFAADRRWPSFKWLELWTKNQPDAINLSNTLRADYLARGRHFICNVCGHFLPYSPYFPWFNSKYSLSLTVSLCARRPAMHGRCVYDRFMQKFACLISFNSVLWSVDNVFRQPWFQFIILNYIFFAYIFRLRLQKVHPIKKKLWNCTKWIT